MSSGSGTEHFVTLFDSYYLPQGLALHASLSRHCPDFHLWIVAVDETCASAVGALDLPRTTVIRLPELEDSRLLSVKQSRTIGEYCWTLTPFLPTYLFARAPALERITYLDADLFFFEDPLPLIAELAGARKDVLITEHAFAPEYAERIGHGRYCVQFMTFRNTAPARRILTWWQDRCLEWCFDREEDGKFGDQKYLDAWPALFPDDVHVLTQKTGTVAPWNVAHLARTLGKVKPVFYHFHGLKLIPGRRLVLFSNYVVGRANRWIYERYVDELRRAIQLMAGCRVDPVLRPLPAENLRWLRHAWRTMRGRFAWTRI